MFKKLKLKFISTIMILLTSIVILIFTAVYVGMSKNGEYLLFSQIGETLNSIKGGLSGEIGGRPHQGENSIILIYDIKNSRLIYNNSYGIEEEALVSIANEVISSKKNKGFIKSGGNNLAYIYRNSPLGIEMVLKDATNHQKTMQRLIITSIFVGTISLVVLFVVSVVIANKSIKPVEAAYNSQKRFIADASHELKTPLAVIKTNLELLNSNRYETINNQIKWVNYISFQTDRMSKLVSNLLYLAKADNNEQLGNESNFNISDCIMNQLLTFEAVIYENDLTLDCNIEENINIFGDKEGINQLVGILMDNAIKHSYKNCEIKVILKREKQKLNLSVINKGNTISKQDIVRIFDRFYRVDESRAREKGGYGLGLAIAKSIVDKFNGKIEVVSENNITKFNVEFIIIEQ